MTFSTQLVSIVPGAVHSPFRLKEWLGHANLNTTQIYVHLAEQDDKKLMEATSL